MVPAREIVLTGVGVVSPIGIGREAFWTSLRRDGAGCVPYRTFKVWPCRSRFGAEILDFDAKQYVQPRKSLKVMCREIQTAFAASTLAMRGCRVRPRPGRSRPLWRGFGDRNVLRSDGRVRVDLPRLHERRRFLPEEWGPKL